MPSAPLSCFSGVPVDQLEKSAVTEQVGDVAQPQRPVGQPAQHSFSAADDVVSFVAPVHDFQYVRFDEPGVGNSETRGQLAGLVYVLQREINACDPGNQARQGDGVGADVALRVDQRFAVQPAL